MSHTRLPAARRSVSRRRARPRGRARRIVLPALLVMLLAAGGTAWWLYRGLDGNLKEDAVDLGKALGDDDHRPRRETAAGDALNLLLLGSDSRTGADAARDGGGVDGARSDTALLVHIAKGRTEAVAVSIPRDTLVDRPECMGTDGTVVPAARRVMFNSVYARAGSACTVKTVEQMSDVRVDHLVEVDFAGFKGIVDAIGGVTVALDRPITSGLRLDAGEHRLDGEQALEFVRTRHGYGDGSDLGRIELQQKFLGALLAEIKRQDLLGSPAKLYRIADRLTESLTTDSELASLGALAELGQSLEGIDPATMDTIMLPVEYDRADPNRVVPAEPRASRLWEALRTDTAIPDEARKSPARGGSS
ncbi:LCP family protein [Streptomyces sp. NPDC005931]|uniref:LCP family protein n=1 Tax=Streptomyces sp. NPDC005931 TaxID=3364737 RepID=UPI003693545A